MRVVGLDIATKTGMALVDGEGGERGKVLQLPDQKGFERLQLIAANARQTLAVWEPELVVVEAYAYCKNVSSFITLVEVGTIIRAVLYEMHLRWVEVPPSALKKWTTGKGNADKQKMAEAVRERWGLVSHSHDIVDAFALAKMGWVLGERQLLDIPGVFFGRTC